MLVWILTILLCFGFGAGAILGAPYLPVLSRDIQPLLDAAALRPGQLILDLGCGDGRLLKAAAKRGVRGYGYEINPFIWLIAVINCWSMRDKVTIKLGNYWRHDWPQADAIYIFLITGYMKKFDQVLTKRALKVRVVSYGFPIPHKTASQPQGNIFVYDYQPK